MCERWVERLEKDTDQGNATIGEMMECSTLVNSRITSPLLLLLLMVLSNLSQSR